MDKGQDAFISTLIANPAGRHAAPDHRKRSHGGPGLVPEFGVAACRIACKRDDCADECVAASLDVCDVAVAKPAVTKCLADHSHVDPKAPLLDDHVRPDVIDQLTLRDDLARTLGKVD